MTRAKALARDLTVELDSAGTGAWHVGEPPYGAMQACAAKRGYDLKSLRARQVTAQDFERFDLIVAMDADNLKNLQELAPNSARAKLALFTDFAPHTGADHVPDPYYTRDFDGTLDLVEICAEALLDQL